MQSLSSTTSEGSQRMSLTQEDLGDEVSWAEDVPDITRGDSSSCLTLDGAGQLSVSATESLKLLHSIGRKTS